MLVLTLKAGEFLTLETVGHDGATKRIAVKIAEIRGPQIRVGVIAPESVNVWRGEVHARLEHTTTDELLNKITTGARHAKHHHVR